MPLILAGCGDGTVSSPHGQRVAVRGVVYLDDKPLERATIRFVPASGDRTVVATDHIMNGSYNIPAERGPLVGKMRVEIRPEGKDFAEFEAEMKKNPRRKFQPETVKIPDRYNVKSELSVDVTADAETNRFVFRLESKGKSRSKR